MSKGSIVGVWKYYSILLGIRSNLSSRSFLPHDASVVSFYPAPRSVDRTPPPDVSPARQPQSLPLDCKPQPSARSQHSCSSQTGPSRPTVAEEDAATTFWWSFRPCRLSLLTSRPLLWPFLRSAAASSPPISRLHLRPLQLIFLPSLIFHCVLANMGDPDSSASSPGVIQSPMVTLSGPMATLAHWWLPRFL